MTKYFTENQIKTMYGCVIGAIDYLNAIRKELSGDFIAPWYVLEKIDYVENFVACIKNRAVDALLEQKN